MVSLDEIKIAILTASEALEIMKAIKWDWGY